MSKHTDIEAGQGSDSHDTDAWHPSPGSWFLVALAWIAVGVPLAWGIWQTLEKAAVLLN